MNMELLKYIVETSKAHAGGNNPHGFCYIEAGHMDSINVLVSSDMVQANVAQRAADGTIPVRPTEAGVKASMETPNLPAPVQHRPPVAMAVESGIPVPDKKAFGRASTGEDKVTQYGFDKWDKHQSVFMPQPEGQEHPIHRTFSSVVSQANKKLWPKNFVIREWPGGARIWRVEDLNEARPTRARKVKQEAQPVTQPGPAFPGGFAAPGHPAFGQTLGAAPEPFGQAQPFSQGGFAEPGAAGGADWGQGPGFDPGLPSFGE